MISFFKNIKKKKIKHRGILFFLGNFFFFADDYRISLKNYDIEDSNPQEFSQQGFIPGMSNVTFSITDIPKNVAFIIFQIHAFQRNVTISYSEKFLLHTKDSVTGSNIGLFYETNGNSSINTYVMNGNNDSVDALFVVLSYTSDGNVCALLLFFIIIIIIYIFAR